MRNKIALIGLSVLAVTFDVPPAALAGAKIQVDGIGLDLTEPAAYWAL